MRKRGAIKWVNPKSKGVQVGEGTRSYVQGDVSYLGTRRGPCMSFGGGNEGRNDKAERVAQCNAKMATQRSQERRKRGVS